MYSEAIMKNKKEILQEYLNNAQETMVKIGIRMDYLQEKYAKENKNSLLQDLAQVTADKKETEEWIAFLNSQLEKEK